MLRGLTAGKGAIARRTATAARQEELPQSMMRNARGMREQGWECSRIAADSTFYDVGAQPYQPETERTVQTSGRAGQSGPKRGALALVAPAVTWRCDALADG